MNIIKGIAGTLAFSAVLIAGCVWLYDNGESHLAEDNSIKVAAEETVSVPFTSLADDSALVTVPISVFGEEELHEFSTVKITFLGDCILASNTGDTREDAFVRYAQKLPPSYFFEKAVPFYEDSDLVIANSEFVLSDSSLSKVSKDDDRSFWFKSPSSYADILKEGRIDFVNIANNHTGDYGTQGYEDTKASLEAAGIEWGDLDHPVYIERNGVTFGIVCTKLFSKDVEPFLTPMIEKTMANSDIQILFFHGGEENEHVPEDWLTEICHQYADMGVDLIVGSHPHVLRPMEEYNGVDIIYSLGNFCYGGHRTPENRTVILTETFTFDVDGNYVSQEESFTPFYVYGSDHNNWQPAPVTDPVEYSRTMSFMYGGSELPIE